MFSLSVYKKLIAYKIQTKFTFLETFGPFGFFLSTSIQPLAIALLNPNLAFSFKLLHILKFTILSLNVKF